MRYQIADIMYGLFGDVFESCEDAEKELQICIAEGQAMYDADAQEYTDCGSDVPRVKDFLSIITV